MTTHPKFFAAADGSYLGAYDGVAPPPDAIEVYIAPASGSDRWNGQAWIPVVPTPVSVTRKAARLALLNARKLQLVQPAIDAMPEPQRTRTQIEWDDSLTFERNNPTLIMLGKALGLDSFDLDDLFIKAAALQ